MLTRAPREVVHLDTSVAVSQLPLWAQYQRIGGPMTPEQLTQALRLADQGSMALLADLFLDARKKDGHLQSILGTREMMLQNLPWEVLPGCDNPRKIDLEAVDVCKAAIADAVGGYDEEGVQLVGFRGLLGHLQGGVSHGYAVSETVYEVRDGHLLPRGWNLLGPRRIVFDQKTARPHWYDAGTPGLTYPGVDLLAGFTPGKIILHQPRITGDGPTSEGLCRVLLWAALFRNWALRDWAALGELAWKPWRKGIYKTKAQQPEIEALIQKLRAWSSGGVAVFNDNADISVEWPKGIGPGASHKELRGELAGDMSKAVVGQTLTTDAGDKGARSLGEVHKDVKADIRESDACNDAETIRRDLFTPLTRLNCGPRPHIPRFRFLTEEAVDLEKFGRGLKALREAGLRRIPAVWVRDRAGIPEADEDDEILEVDIPIDPKTGLPTTPGSSSDDADSDDGAEADEASGDESDDQADDASSDEADDDESDETP